MDNCKNVLDAVIENGRVSGNDNGEFIAEELVEQVKFEAQEQGLDVDECVAFALNHTRHT